MMRHLALILIILTRLTPADAFDLQGHRGARGLAPENTLPAFATALQIGVTTLELDVGVTKDGVVVVSHDRMLNPDLTRDPDGQFLARPGPLIHELTLADLKQYDVGRLRPGTAYAAAFPLQRPVDGTRIPTLREVFALADHADTKVVRFNIETKLTPHPARRHPIRRRLRRRCWRSCVRPAWRRGSSSNPSTGARWSPYQRNLDATAMADAKAAGIQVIPWTVNEPADMERLIDLGVDGLISDYPDRLRAVLGSRNIPLPAPVALR